MKCDCKKWQDNINKLNAAWMISHVHGTGGYTGEHFKFCPWCGVHLTIEEKEKPIKDKMMTECYSCKSKDNVTGNAQIKCNNPDTEMTGDAHGIRNGWFFYPILFDPTWKTKLCSNYEEVK